MIYDYWNEWNRTTDWIPQNYEWNTCSRCGMRYQGQWHYCTNQQTTWAYPTVVEKKMDKKVAILKIAESLAILNLVVEEKMEFDDVFSNIEELLNKALEELLSD